MDKEYRGDTIKCLTTVMGDGQHADNGNHGYKPVCGMVANGIKSIAGATSSARLGPETVLGIPELNSTEALLLQTHSTNNMLTCFTCRYHRYRYTAREEEEEN